MRLLLEHPRVALRDCEFCQQYEHNDGENGDQLPVRGTETDFMPRPKPDKFFPLGYAPCRVHQAGKSERACPKGTPENPNSLNERNQQAYDHYKECQATGQFPDDPIVRQNAAIISGIETEHERSEQVRLLEIVMLKSRAAALGAGNG